MRRSNGSNVVPRRAFPTLGPHEARLGTGMGQARFGNVRWDRLMHGAGEAGLWVQGRRLSLLADAWPLVATWWTALHGYLAHAETPPP